MSNHHLYNVSQMKSTPLEQSLIIDVAIVGVQKCGTTSLKHYLTQHPAITSHYTTEFSYFADPEYQQTTDTVIRKHFGATSIKLDQSILVKYSAMLEIEKNIARLHQHNPSCRVIFMVREPVDRAFSSYRFEVSNGYQRDFNEILAAIDQQNLNDEMYTIFFQLGLYSHYYQLLTSYFPPEQIYIVDYSEFKKDASLVSNDIFRWMALDSPIALDVTKVYNISQPVTKMGRILNMVRSERNPIKRLARSVLPTSTYHRLVTRLLDLAIDQDSSLTESNNSKNKILRPELSDSTRRHLHRYYQDDVRRFKEIANLELPYWQY